MGEIVYLNGRLMPKAQASVSPLDYAFLYGYGLFETLRAYQGWVFRLEQHLARLRCSAKVLGLDSQIDRWDLKVGVYDTLRANGLSQARLRITIAGGEGEMSPDLSSCKETVVFIIAKDYTPYMVDTYNRGFKAVVSSVRKNSRSPLSRIKSNNYLDSLLARREAKAAGVEEALLLNEQSFLAEGGISNIFLVSGGILLTPHEDSGVLPGITREVVLELASLLDIRVEVGKVTLEQLLEAEEAFLTNSLWEIMPLTRVGERTIGSGIPGRFTRTLRQAYTELVERERASFPKEDSVMLRK